MYWFADAVLCLVQVFSGLLIGAMLPYWFSAMTMKSVGKAALAMVEEVRRQFATISGLMEGTARPDYRRCVEISTAVRPCLAYALSVSGQQLLQGWPLTKLTISAPYTLSAVQAFCLARSQEAVYANTLHAFVCALLQASLSEMIPPGCLVMLTPVVVGVLFGTRTLAGVLAGALVSGVQMAVSMSNTGSAWDNAKKYVEVRSTALFYTSA